MKMGGILSLLILNNLSPIFTADYFPKARTIKAVTNPRPFMTTIRSSVRAYSVPRPYSLAPVLPVHLPLFFSLKTGDTHPPTL
jgi:hypothetical protein